ncbi:hypothetical protein TNCV_188761 [Trichonephila clavipes]|nr:hypothetical protein TNCV_188761 [Trichonephila clavipes]
MNSQDRHMGFPHFRHGQRAINNRNSNAELAVIHFIYGLAKGNGRVDVRLYEEIYQTRGQPNNQTLAGLHQNQVEHGSFRAPTDDTHVNSKMDLVARISIAAATIRETPGIFEHGRQSMPRRCRSQRKDILSRSMTSPKRGKFPKTPHIMMYLWVQCLLPGVGTRHPFRWGKRRTQEIPFLVNNNRADIKITVAIPRDRRPPITM